jgi:hypothetical protein
MLIADQSAKGPPHKGDEVAAAASPATPLGITQSLPSHSSGATLTMIFPRT